MSEEMKATNWPDPKRKGYPLNHKVSAWHLLRTGSGIDTPFYWDAIDAAREVG